MKQVKIESSPIELKSRCNFNFFTIKSLTLIFVTIISLTIFLIFRRNHNFKFDKNFDYIHYENDFITEKMKNDAGWHLTLDHAYLINGLIRKYKPKNCLEIGVARGGSAILILNAIKDIPNSNLVSIDIRENYFGDKTKKTGYLVKEKFPELSKKWTLFLGDMPYKFLSNLNQKFDFVFLDAAHVSPGEFMNLIEVFPFLRENTIVVLHDIVWHYFSVYNTSYNIYDARVMPTQNFLMSALIGEKILLNDEQNGFVNIGVICLNKNQKQYYLNYFLLLMNIWQYLPTEEQLIGLRKFIIKYYNNDVLLRIYDYSVEQNRKFFINLKNKKYKLEY